ncbi:MAG: hypothetical protein FJ271_09235 [Planctomycetes bacterium]|nr:hypothetical protein [Planctomycetota bacterium]
MNVETVSEFLDRHPGPAVAIGNGCWLFPDGWRCWNDLAGRDPALTLATAPVRAMAPPTDAGEMLKMRYRYHSVRAERLAADFARLKSIVLGDARGRFEWDDAAHGGPDPRDAAKALERLRDLTRAERAIVADLQAQIDNLPEEIERRAHEEWARRLNEQQRQAAEARTEAIAAIEL